MAMEHQHANKLNLAGEQRDTAWAIKNSLSVALAPQGPLLHLQQSIGNRAVGRLIQAKLKISRAGDAYEQEADRVADQVMRMPDPATTYEAGLSHQPEVPQIQRLCTDCEEEEAMRKTAEEEEDEKPAAGPIQTKTTSGAAPQVMQSAEPHVGESGGGGPLPNAVRSFFAARFGHDFGQVKLHTNTRAADSARSLNARAYTIGSDIAFAAGEYRPDTTEGR